LSVIELNGNYYSLMNDASGRATVTQSYVQRLATAYRTVGVQRRQDDTSVNRYVNPGFPKGIGWGRAKRDSGRGVGGMLDSTSWTAKGPVALGRLQETQSHAAPREHLVKALNFKGDLWGIFEENYASDEVTSGNSGKFGSSSDDWTGGGTIQAASGGNNTHGRRIFDAAIHKGNLWVIGNGNSTGDEDIYQMSYSADGATWSAGSGAASFPDGSGDEFVTDANGSSTVISRRHNFNDDYARILDYGTMMIIAIYEPHTAPGGGDGDGVVAIWSTVDAGTNWVAEVSVAAGAGPKAFVDWYNTSGARSPVLIIPEGVYEIDVTNNVSNLMFPLDGDPNNGRHSVVGPDGALYVGLGNGDIIRLHIAANGVLEIMNVGPPGDGLVAARQGYPTCMLRVPNEFLVVAYGGHAANKYASIFLIDTSSILQDEETGKHYMPWHHLYQHGSDNADIVTMAYSNEDNATPRLHFAVEGASATTNYHIEEPFTNPEQTTTAKYQATSIVRLPDDDLGDPQSTTMVLQAMVDADDLSADTDDEFIALRYGTNGASDTTTTLGNFFSGTLTQSFGSGAGIATRRLGINLLLDRGSTTTNTPKLHEFELQGHHVLQDKLAWDFVIDVAATARDYSPDVISGQATEEVIISNLETVAQSTTLVTFTAGRMTQTRVRVPNDVPPQFDLSVVDSFGQDTGRRTGFVRIRVEQGI